MSLCEVNDVYVMKRVEKRDEFLGLGCEVGKLCTMTLGRQL